MGLYAINCPACSAPHMWFSGSMDQRCAACKAPREWEIQEAPTAILPPDLRVAQRRFPGQVNAIPHWTPVIEKSYADLLEKQVKELQSQLLTEKAEVSRLLALCKRRSKA